MAYFKFSIMRSWKMGLEKIIRLREERCTGCRVCEMICSLEKEGIFNPHRSRIKVFQRRPKGLDIPLVCQLCDPAPCVNICPSGALRKNTNTGAIFIDKETCIGERCLACTIECPYGAIAWDVLDESLICCDLCGGDPECVKFCDTRALEFEKCDQLEIQEQRSHLGKLLQPFLEIQGNKSQGGLK
jgi:carbon-monoxide dehydrogenase iron sulfur subunit